MFIIQQSSSFRLWTSRALMVYFRRALLFLVVSHRQNSIPSQRLTQEQIIYFSDAEDDDDNEEIMINNTNKINQSIKNHIKYSPIKNQSNQSLIMIDFTEQQKTNSKIFPMKTSENIEMIDNSIHHYQIKPLSSHFNYIDSIVSSPVNYINITKDPLHSYSLNHQLSTLSHSSLLNNEEYQTSFSNIFHSNKNFNTNHQKDKYHTSIITVRPLSFHYFQRHTIDYSIFTNHISVRLISYDRQSIECRKSFPIKINKYQSIQFYKR